MELLLKFSRTSLHIAVENGNAEIVKMLLSKKEIDINALLILLFDVLISFLKKFILIQFVIIIL